MPLPAQWATKLDTFQSILVLKALRPDKVTNAMQLLVADKLGQKFIEPQTTDLSLVYKDSSPTSPLVFVLSAGTDPAKALYSFAEEMKFTKKLQAISLGQGQVSEMQFYLSVICTKQVFPDPGKFLKTCFKKIQDIAFFLIDIMFSSQSKTSHFPTSISEM